MNAGRREHVRGGAGPGLPGRPPRAHAAPRLSSARPRSRSGCGHRDGRRPPPRTDCWVRSSHRIETRTACLPASGCGPPQPPRQCLLDRTRPGRNHLFGSTMQLPCGSMA